MTLTQQQAVHAARMASLTLNMTQAAAWYRITGPRVCQHPEQAIVRVRVAGLDQCTCRVCLARWREIR